MTTIHNPIHPGEIVRDTLICEDSPFDDIAQAANALGVHRVTLSRLFNGHSGISQEMACRLSLLIGNSVDIWLGLQCDYDIAQAKGMLKKYYRKSAANHMEILKHKSK